MRDLKDKNDFSKYEEYINLGLYEEMITQLIKNAEQKGTVELINKQKYLNGFFVEMFSEDVYEKLESSGAASLVYPVVFERIDSDPELSLIKKNIGRFINSQMTNKFFDVLVSSGNLDVAEVISQYVSKQAEDHAELFSRLAQDKKEKEFQYLIGKMNNIHFDNDRLLNLTLDLNPTFSNYMINKFGFDINKEPTLNGEPDKFLYSFVHSTIIESSNGHLKNLMTNHLEKINLNAVDINTYGRYKLLDFVLSQEPTYEQLKIFLAPEYALKMKTDDIYQIFFYMLREDKIQEFANTDIFNDFFRHPNFENKYTKLKQPYLFYEILENLNHATIARSKNNNKDNVGAFLKIYYSYLNNANLSDIPVAQDYHQLGAVIYTYNYTSVIDRKKLKNHELYDAVIMTAKRYPELINTPNPNKEYCLQQVEEGSDMYTLLKKMGAEIPGSFRKLFGRVNMIESVSNNVEFLTFVEPQRRISLNTNSMIDKITAVKQEKEILWKSLVGGANIHPNIAVTYNDIYSKSLELLTYIEKNSSQTSNAYEEIHYITNAMPKQIQDAINSYTQIVEAASRLSDKSRQLSGEQEARNSCIKQLEAISESLKKSSDKFYNLVSEDAMQKLRTNERIVAGNVGRLNGEDFEVNADMTAKIKARAQISANQKVIDDLNNKNYDIDLSNLHTDVVEQESTNSDKTVKRFKI